MAAIDARLEAGYERFVGAIAAAHDITNGAPFVRNAADREQGESFVRGIVNHSLAASLGNTPEQPVMQLLPYPDTRLGYNNPDNLYYVARVSDTGSYTISGTRGTSVGLLVQALGPGLPGTGAAAGATKSFFAGNELELGPDGSYSLALSTDPPPRGDWLPLRPGTDNMLVRFSFLDWEREEPGSITITRDGGPASNRVEVTPALAAAMLEETARWIPLQAEFYRDQGNVLTALGPNTLVGPRRALGDAGTNVQQWNLTGNFDLRDHEALLVTLKDVSQAHYANFMVADPWLDIFEFVHHQTSLNASQVRVDGDGYVRYVLCARDPGVPNWIDTSELSHGAIFGRYQDVEGELGPEYAPTASVVDLADLRRHLPGDTPSVGRHERAEQLAARERLLAVRFRGADPQHPEIVRRLDAVETLLGHALPLHTIHDQDVARLGE
ncbi:MAG TPA: hypothetical protein VEP49_03360 [Acidimicrobiia bacterium]|nr:hypothetical protein [Acidimicrobiia bacterium]